MQKEAERTVSHAPVKFNKITLKISDCTLSLPTGCQVPLSPPGPPRASPLHEVRELTAAPTRASQARLLFQQQRTLLAPSFADGDYKPQTMRFYHMFFSLHMHVGSVLIFAFHDCVLKSLERGK